MVIAEESLTRDLMVEIVPILQEHKKALPGYMDEPININWKIYEILAEGGLLRIYTVRDDGMLVGYAVFTLNPNTRHQHILQAQQEVLYLRPDFRKGTMGLLLIKYADKALSEVGVQVILHNVNVSYDISALLKRVGYVPLEQTYIKRV